MSTFGDYNKNYILETLEILKTDALELTTFQIVQDTLEVLAYMMEGHQEVGGTLHQESLSDYVMNDGDFHCRITVGNLRFTIQRYGTIKDQSVHVYSSDDNFDKPIAELWVHQAKPYVVELGEGEIADDPE